MSFLPTLVAAIDLSTLPQQLINGLMTGAIYALIALGYTMVYGVLKLINFAHGEVFMLGTFCALFVSWTMGYSPGQASTFASTPVVLLTMLLVSMLVCGLIGVSIERLAYRPMRSSPRIAALITAIGVSLMLQHGGALFLPVSPPQAINEYVNPYHETAVINIVPPNSTLKSKADQAKTELKTAQENLKAAMQAEGAESEFDLKTDAAKEARSDLRSAEANQRNTAAAADNSAIRITVSYGRLIMFGITVILMFLLRVLVMNTPMGRQMRAVSHDFDSASLMGINVNKVVTFTFFIGSALAGAGGMMAATFQGISLTPFSGVEYGVKAFVAAVLGGIGNIPGAVLGGLLMGVAESAVTASGKSEYKDIVAFIILIVILLFKPGGLLGSAKAEKV